MPHSSFHPSLVCWLIRKALSLQCRFCLPQFYHLFYRYGSYPSIGNGVLCCPSIGCKQWPTACNLHTLRNATGWSSSASSWLSPLSFKVSLVSLACTCWQLQLAWQLCFSFSPLFSAVRCGLGKKEHLVTLILDSRGKKGIGGLSEPVSPPLGLLKLLTHDKSKVGTVLFELGLRHSHLTLHLDLMYCIPNEMWLHLAAAAKDIFKNTQLTHRCPSNFRETLVEEAQLKGQHAAGGSQFGWEVAPKLRCKMMQT